MGLVSSFGSKVMPIYQENDRTCLPSNNFKLHSNGSPSYRGRLSRTVNTIKGPSLDHAKLYHKVLKWSSFFPSGLMDWMEANLANPGRLSFRTECWNQFLRVIDPETRRSKVPSERWCCCHCLIEVFGYTYLFYQSATWTMPSFPWLKLLNSLGIKWWEHPGWISAFRDLK